MEMFGNTQNPYINNKRKSAGIRFRKAVCLAAALVIPILGYLQFGRDVEVCSSNLKIFSDGSREEIAIIANKLYIFDLEKFAESVLQRCADNSFKEVRFSYDLSGYPKEVYISVYMNQTAWKWKKEAFEIHYVPEGEGDCNIADDPERFRMEIKKNH